MYRRLLPQLAIVVAFSGACLVVASGLVDFKPAIAPGKMGKGKGSCAVAEAAPKSAPVLRVTEARFEAER